ncbi:MAG TPA: hypothetical protein VFO95_14275 [Gemmatimonadales bacterium]|nr:hypothetical protein [Gemmatimonadales bacterium]
MTVFLGIGAMALLFVAFGLVRRGREPEHGCGGCTACTGGCALEKGNSDVSARRS